MKFTSREMEIIEEAIRNRCTILEDIMETAPMLTKLRVEKLWVEIADLLIKILEGENCRVNSVSNYQTGFTPAKAG